MEGRRQRNSDAARLNNISGLRTHGTAWRSSSSQLIVSSVYPTFGEMGLILMSRIRLL